MVARRLYDTCRTVMILDTEVLRRKIIFFNNAAQFMVDWADEMFAPSTKFTPGTMKAVQLTSTTLARAIPDLLLMSEIHNLGIDYTCTARLNLDYVATDALSRVRNQLLDSCSAILGSRDSNSDMMLSETGWLITN